MYPAILERFRGEQEVGVPRRFSIGAVFVLVTFYCVLFRLLVLLGADATWTGLCCIFVGVVTIAQTAWFQGVRPRAASVLAGAITAPALLFVVMLDERFTRLMGLSPVANGFGTFGRIIPLILMLIVLGLGCGYFVGATLAGVFYVLGKVRPSSVQPIGTDQKESSSRFLDWLDKSYNSVGRILNPAPHGTPLRGAIGLFEVSVLLGFLLAPFVNFAAYHHVLVVCTVIGLVLAIWSANLELLIFWPIALAAIGFFTASWIFDAMMTLPFFAENFGHQSSPLLRLARMACVMTGLTVSACAGWLQWLVVRKSQKVRFGPIAFAVCCLVMVALAIVATQGIYRFANTPNQKLYARIFSDGGHVGWNGDLSLSYLDLPETLGDAELLQLLPHTRAGVHLHLNGPMFTDASIAALDGWSFGSLYIANTSLSQDAFANLTGFSSMFVTFNQHRVTAKMLADLVKDPTMRGMLQTISFLECEVDANALAELRVCGALNTLMLHRCSDTNEAITELTKLLRLQTLTISQSGLTDDQMDLLAESLATASARSSIAVSRLTLDGNDISDEGLMTLGKLTTLRSLSVKDNDRITAEGIREFEQLFPSCNVTWSEPN